MKMFSFLLIVFALASAGAAAKSGPLAAEEPVTEICGVEPDGSIWLSLSLVQVLSNDSIWSQGRCAFYHRDGKTTEATSYATGNSWCLTKNFGQEESFCLPRALMTRMFEFREARKLVPEEYDIEGERFRVSYRPRTSKFLVERIADTVFSEASSPGSPSLGDTSWSVIIDPLTDKPTLVRWR